MDNRIFEATALGAIELTNRVIMAPMTRSRAGDGDAPTPLNAEYYAQRAGAGLIITEGTQPSPSGKGYCRTPGIYSAEQLAGWTRVTQAVHEAGGNMVMQLMHCGRIGSKHNKEPGAETVAPSAIRAACGRVGSARAQRLRVPSVNTTLTAAVPMSTPHAITARPPLTLNEDFS